jgi:ADP-ribosylglycohydrolase
MLYGANWRAAMIEAEIQQRREEGYDVAALQEHYGKVEAYGVEPESYQRFWQSLDALPFRDDYPYEEPSHLAEIQEMRPDGPRKLELDLQNEILEDKMLGAWLGRCAGCLVGKPCEGWTREAIREYLSRGNAYPLEGYFPFISEAEELIQGRPLNWMRGHITEMPRDDDTDYTVLGLYVLEKYGRTFTTEDIAFTWLESLPYLRTYTAERVAYHNLLRDIQPLTSAVWQNPYREWIGAQIRADSFGYVNPGNPERAAEYGWRDARLSHVKNGIYGEMWAAAMIAAAFAKNDPLEIIEIGLSEIPAFCRLTEAIQDTLKVASEAPTWEDAWDQLMARYGDYHPVHTINNAIIVALGLLYGQRDFAQSISIAVMGGLDTDCNGATVGSIVGTMLGAEALPSDYVAPLDDRLRSAVFGFDGSAISGLAQRTAAIAKGAQRDNED